MNRRQVLAGVGTAGAVGVGLTGVVSASGVDGKPVFCGCSQICVCLGGRADVLMGIERDDGSFEVGFVVGDGELDPYPDGEPRYSGNVCVSTDDAGVPDGKIIGLQVADTRWINPNQCARKALDAERRQLDSEHTRATGEGGGPCGKPPCEHPGRGGGRPEPGDDGDERGNGNPGNGNGRGR